MTYSVEKVTDAPIVIMVHESRQSPEELQEVMSAVTSTLDAQPGPVFLVLDIHGLELGVDDLTNAASSGARGPGAVLHHPKIRENLVVSSKSLVKLAMKGLTTATFGNVKVKVFKTQEEAVAYARQQIGGTG